MYDDLAKYATTVTKGRLIKENPPKYRTEFQRDRDRIIHSSAFRRLEYKTQVFINHEGDLFRTRLTHSLEVAQIGRSVATALKLNEDLVEAICLAHDLGHTPFGHVGQDVLNKLLHELGFSSGFEHNLQSLRIVDKLEERYASFDGLNLTYETREGILKHCSPKLANQLGEVGQRFLQHKKPSLEAQLANVADELAYNYHDVDDGLRSNLISLDDLQSIDFIKEKTDIIKIKYPQLSGRRLHKELVRNLISYTIYDLIENTKINIGKYNINSVADVINCGVNIVSYSDLMSKNQSELKKFLHKNLYKHISINQLRYKASMVIKSLFEAYMGDYSLLPNNYSARIDQDGLHRVVADYISGMTDRYAFRQYNKLFTVDAI
jgi:dGTPase